MAGIEAVIYLFKLKGQRSKGDTDIAAQTERSILILRDVFISDRIVIKLIILIVGFMDMTIKITAVNIKKDRAKIVCNTGWEEKAEII